MIFPIILAATLGTLFSTLWHSPKLFGKKRSEATDTFPITPEKSSKTLVPKMKWGRLFGFLFNLITAGALLALFRRLGIHDILSALELAILLWFGFMMPLTLGPMARERKSWQSIAAVCVYRFCIVAILSLTLVSFL